MSYKKNDPESGVIQSPNGEIQYYTKSIDNKHNPYVNKSIKENKDPDFKSDSNSNLNDSNVEYAEVACNGTIVIMPISDINNALLLERKAIIVRYFCLFDLVINIYISLSCYYASLFSTLIATISLMGYTSTITYNKKGLILYLMYHYLQSISKIAIFTMYIFYNSSYNSSYDEIVVDDTASLTIIDLREDGPGSTITTNYTQFMYVEIIQLTTQNACILIMATAVEVYITSLIQKFYNFMPN